MRLVDLLMEEGPVGRATATSKLGGIKKPEPRLRFAKGLGGCADYLAPGVAAPAGVSNPGGAPTLISLMSSSERSMLGML